MHTFECTTYTGNSSMGCCPENCMVAHMTSRSSNPVQHPLESAVDIFQIYNTSVVSMQKIEHFTPHSLPIQESLLHIAQRYLLFTMGHSRRFIPPSHRAFLPSREGEKRNALTRLKRRRAMPMQVCPRSYTL